MIFLASRRGIPGNTGERRKEQAMAETSTTHPQAGPEHPTPPQESQRFPVLWERLALYSSRQFSATENCLCLLLSKHQ
jgi:hypothetical protein